MHQMKGGRLWETGIPDVEKRQCGLFGDPKGVFSGQGEGLKRQERLEALTRHTKAKDLLKCLVGVRQGQTLGFGNGCIGGSGLEGGGAERVGEGAQMGLWFQEANYISVQMPNISHFAPSQVRHTHIPHSTTPPPPTHTHGYLAKHCPWAGDINVTWKVVRNARSRGQPQTYQVRKSGAGAGHGC